MQNKIILITYPDSMGGNLHALKEVLTEFFKDSIGGIHILPFFPSSGDRGFSPITYEQVQEEFGDWNDILKLSEQYDLMCDVMVNHASVRSKEFIDYIEKGSASEYSSMFLNYEEFWGKPNLEEEELKGLYRRKESEPYKEVLVNGKGKSRIWCTFTEEQVDLDVRSEKAKEYLIKTIDDLISKGFKAIRLDAVGYVIKKKGTNCFMVEPEIWDFIHWLEASIKEKDTLLLPEIHDTWHVAKKLENEGIWSYDFVLPLLMLNTLYRKDATKLTEWLNTAPRTQFTVLDTHDGIGVYDAHEWVSEAEAEQLIKHLEDKLSYSYKLLNPEKKKFYRAYQLYATYFSALHEDNKAYLLARAIQFYAPGIPQVYYVGMLAGENDYVALADNIDHRSINRHNYSIEEIKENIDKPVVQQLLNLMKFRNSYEGFNGDIMIENPRPYLLNIIRYTESSKTRLECDLRDYSFTIVYEEEGKIKKLLL